MLGAFCNACVSLGRDVVQAIDKKSLQLLRLLRQEYSLVLSRDATLEKDLAAVEAAQFGVRPQNGGLEGLFGNMFGSLLG